MLGGVFSFFRFRPGPSSPPKPPVAGCRCCRCCWWCGGGGIMAWVVVVVVEEAGPSESCWGGGGMGSSCAWTRVFCDWGGDWWVGGVLQGMVVSVWW